MMHNILTTACNSAILLIFHYLLNGTKYVRPDQLLKLSEKDWGTIYSSLMQEKDLDPHAVNCMYHRSRNMKKSKYIRCPDKFSCFFLLSNAANKNSDLKIIKNQGCWPKAKYNCSSSECSPQVTDNVNNSSRKTEFCCCSGNLCNKDIQPTKHLQTMPITTKASKSTTSSTLILTIVVSSATVVFIIACLSALYCWKQKQKKNTNTYRLSKTFHRGSFTSSEISSKSMSAQTLDNILHGNLIHQGCHSAVRLGSYEQETVAVKVFPPRSKLQWHNEKRIYKMLGEHANIAKFIASNQIQRDTIFEGVIVMAYYKEGSLLNYLRQHTLTWKEMIRLAYCVANGLAYLHGESEDRNGSENRIGIAHRDLNSRNILVKSDGTCVLADFGFALRLVGSLPCDNCPVVGSPRYMAPEILDGTLMLSDWTSALKQVDSYALGLVLWELCRRCTEICLPDTAIPKCMLPYEKELGTGPILQKVKQYACKEKLRPQFPQQWKPNDFALSYLKSTIQECWDHDAGARLTPLCVLNRLKQMQDNLSAEKQIYKETLGHDTEIYYGEDTEIVCGSNLSTSHVIER